MTHKAEEKRLKGYLGTIHKEFVDQQALILLLGKNLTLLPNEWTELTTWLKSTTLTHFYKIAISLNLYYRGKKF